MSLKIKGLDPFSQNFRMKHHLVLVHSYKNFELNNSNFAQVIQFRETFQKF